MAYTTIDDPTIYFNTKLYTGNATDDTTISGVGFQSDWTWIKSRGDASWHQVTDSVRGAGNVISTNSNGAESNFSSLKSFNSDGFVLSDNSNFNGNGVTFASWNWKAGGTASSNSDGSITSSVSASTTAGFSIVKFTASGSGDETVGHGLGGVKPKMVITKGLDASSPWNTYNENLHSSAPEDYYLALNSTNASSSDSPGVFGAGMTSSVIGVGVGVGFTSGEDYIAYCFAEKKGYSKFGSYTGNGNADGTFVYTGFKPAWVMIKRTTGSVYNWIIFDNKRNTFNVIDDRLRANTNDAEQTGSSTHILDFVSNGFKIRSSNSAIGGGGDPYIYMAFAENPFVTSTGIPTTAR
jgi:hypothetical protein